MEKLKVFEAFAGYGSQSIALQNIGADFEIVGISEIDKYAIQGYYALHDNSIPNFGDISKINPKDLPQFDLFTYSFPCFIRDTKVLTYKGYKNIQDVEVGDYVLTHTRTYQKVTKTMDKLACGIYELNVPCSEPIYATAEHPFYVRKFHTHPEWKPLKELTPDYYIGIAIDERLESRKDFLTYCSKFSTNEAYLLFVGQLIAKHHHKPYKIELNTIEVLNEGFYDNGIVWCPIYSVQKTDRIERVYNLEVERDNSYTVNNIIVHNCQDVSISGHQKGLVKGQTRSGLLYECEKIIEHCKPKYLLLENVKNLVGKKFIDDFQEWLKYLESLGYTNYWKVLSASDYGIAQKRERVFCVSILGEHKPFEFPEPIPLEKCIRDYMDDEVDEKYYLSEEQISKFLPNKNFAYSIYSILSHNDKIQDLARAGMLDVKWRDQLKRIYFDNGCCPTLDTNGGGHHEPKILCIGFINSKDTDEKHQSNEVFDDNGVIRTITACDYKCPPIVGDFAVKTDIKSSQHNRVYDENGVSRALTASDYKHPAYIRIEKDYLPVMFIDNEESELYGKFILDLDLCMTIRKLTPIECLRLMGLKEEEIQKLVDSRLSNSRLYKLAGNSICVPVLEGIFREMLNT